MIIIRDGRKVVIPEYAVCTPETIGKCGGSCPMCWENYNEPCWCRLLFDTTLCPGPSIPMIDIRDDAWQMRGKVRG